MGNVIARQRLFLNADKTKLVAEGDTEGAFLYAAPGDEIPEEAHELFGLENGALPDFKPVDPGETDDRVPHVAPPPGPKEKAVLRQAKARAKAEKGAVRTKEAAPGQDKEDKPGDDKSHGGSGGAGESGGAGDGTQEQ